MEGIDVKEESTPLLYDFKCTSCFMTEKAHYKGTTPPFSRNIVLKHPSYVMKDPFNPPGQGEVLVLGADCGVCDKPVCISKDCSFFFKQMYCLACAINSESNFPSEVKTKISMLKRSK